LYEVVGDLVTVLEAMHLVPDSVPEEHVYVRVAEVVMGVEGTGVTGVVGVVGIEIVPALVVAQV
jgi:hypothetical protein